MKRLISKKLKHDRTDLCVTVEAINNWPSCVNLSLSVKWTRGKHSGITSPVRPAPRTDSSVSYHFNEQIHLSCTLSKENGRHKRKLMSFKILAVEGRTSPIGSISFDLGEFAELARSGPIRNTFIVSNGPDTEQVRKPELVIVVMRRDIEHRLESVDISLPSMPSEGISESSGLVVENIPEEDEPGISTIVKKLEVELEEEAFTSPQAPIQGGEQPMLPSLTPISTPAPFLSTGGQSSRVSAGVDRGAPLLTTVTSQRRFARVASAPPVRHWGWQEQKEEQEIEKSINRMDETRSHHSKKPNGNRAVSSLSIMSSTNLDEDASPTSCRENTGHSRGIIEALLKELLTTAVLECAVYLAYRPRTATDERALTTPARRLARSVLASGREQGVQLGHTALAAVQTRALAVPADICRQLFWWSNVIHLRWIFWAVCRDSDKVDLELSWAMDYFRADLIAIETSLIRTLSEHLWHILLATVKDSATSLQSGEASLQNGEPHTAAFYIEEKAIKEWIRGLERIVQHIDAPKISLSCPRPLTTLAKRVVMQNIISKLDDLFLRDILGDTTNSEKLYLRAASRPFKITSGLNVQLGMNLKMITAKIANWVIDSNLKIEAPVMPRLTAAANLLTLPKQALFDPHVRQEAAPGLAPKLVWEVIKASAEASNAGEDPVPPTLLVTLQEGAIDSQNEGLYEVAYDPPLEAILLDQGLLQGSLRLAPDADSDEEIGEYAKAFSGKDGEDACHRYQMLKELWACR